MILICLALVSNLGASLSRSDVKFASASAGHRKALGAVGLPERWCATAGGDGCERSSL